MRVAVIGLGEAGSLYASGFAAEGWAVTGFDPADNATPEGVSRFADVAEAVAGSDLVLSLAGGKAALRAAAAATPHPPATALFADMNAAPAALNREIAATVASDSGALFADVSVLGSVPTYGAQAPLVVSGPGSTRAAELFGTIGTPVEDITGKPGDASDRKLHEGPGRVGANGARYREERQDPGLPGRRCVCLVASRPSRRPSPTPRRLRRPSPTSRDTNN